MTDQLRVEFVLLVVLALDVVLLGAFLHQRSPRYGKWLRKPFAVFLLLNTLVALFGLLWEISSNESLLIVFDKAELGAIAFAALVFCGISAWLHRPAFKGSWMPEFKLAARASAALLFLAALSSLFIITAIFSPSTQITGKLLESGALTTSLLSLFVILAVVYSSVLLWKYSSKQKRKDMGYTRLLMVSFDILFVLYFLVALVPKESVLYTVVHITTIPPLMAMLYVFSVPTVLERISPSIEKAAARKPEFELGAGQGYLVKISGKGSDFFVHQVMHGVRGLWITKVEPSKVRARYGLKKTPTIWMSFRNVAGTLSPLDLDEITRKISELEKKTRGGVIFIDCLDLIKTVNGFDRTMKFVKEIGMINKTSGWSLLFEADASVFTREQLVEIERELEVVDV
ncbi:MAG: DUF835 domain-containing protein [Candidatus Hadarchaeota archaeon]